MRITSLYKLGLLALLLSAANIYQLEAGEFNRNCGLLGSFAQYREHYRHCKATEQTLVTNVAPAKVSRDNCGPTASRGIGDASTGINAGAAGLAATAGKVTGDNL